MLTDLHDAALGLGRHHTACHDVLQWWNKPAQH
jgi:hypothetical protein